MKDKWSEMKWNVMRAFFMNFSSFFIFYYQQHMIVNKTLLVNYIIFLVL